MLPLPEPALLAHSKRVKQYIQETIIAESGAISFARFMDLALYAPGLGYYQSGLRKFGEQGDFITAPELSPLFSGCVAQQCQQALNALGGGDILEFGAGSGVMAAEILNTLENQGCLPYHYFILEVSGDLRSRQQQLLQARLPHLIDRVHWLERLPETPISGVMLANEVLDAMPAQRFQMEENGGISNFYVINQGENFAWQLQTQPESGLLAKIPALAQLPPGYISEYHPFLRGWVSSAAASLGAGLILIIDYGFPRHEYYHPQRNAGTLRCHYRHYAHDDPFFYPGLQDITAHVDFTAVAEAAVDAGLQVAGYTTQSHFLLGCGLERLFADSDPQDLKTHIPLSQQLKKLLQPYEMGELFKAIALTRRLDISLRGFIQDQRQRL